MKHILHKCNDEHCFCCNGGLSSCTVCEGAEAAMPTDCPGRLLTVIEMLGIQNGTLDFIAGSWIIKPKETSC